MPNGLKSGSESKALIPRWLLGAAGYCLALLIIAATLWLVGEVVFAVPLLLYSLLAAVLAAALLEPVVGFLSRRGVPRWLAAVVTELGLIVLLAGAGTFMVRRVMAQADDLSGAVDEALTNLQNILGSPPLSLSEQRIAGLRRTVVDYVQDLAVSPAAGATIALEILSGIAIMVFVLFFLLKDGPQMWSWALRWAGPDRRDRADQLGDRAWETLTGYTHGVVVIALADAVSIGAGLFFLGVPLWISLTLLVFIGAFIPFVGATVSGVLAVGVTAVTVGTWQALVVLVIVLVVQQVEGNLLQPLVMGRAVELHPVVVLVSVTAGGLLAGIGGAVLAVPLVAVAYRVTELLIGPSSSEDPVDGSTA